MANNRKITVFYKGSNEAGGKNILHVDFTIPVLWLYYNDYLFS